MVRSFARRLVSKRDLFVRIGHILSAKHDPPIAQALLAEVRATYEETSDRENYEDREKFVRATGAMARLTRDWSNGSTTAQAEFAQHFCWACFDDFLCTEKTCADNRFVPVWGCSCLAGAGVWFCSSKCWHLRLKVFNLYGTGIQMYGTGWHRQDVVRWTLTAQVRQHKKDAENARHREEARARWARHARWLQDCSSSSNSSDRNSSSSSSSSSGSSMLQQHAAGRPQDCSMLLGDAVLRRNQKSAKPFKVWPVGIPIGRADLQGAPRSSALAMQRHAARQ